MGLLTLPFPTVGGARNIQEIYATRYLTSAVALLNGNLDGANCRAFRGFYRTFASGSAGVKNGSTSGVFLTGGYPSFNIKSGATNSGGIWIIPIVASQQAVTGLSTRLRVQGIVCTNGTAPGINFTFGFYPVASLVSTGTGPSAIVDGVNVGTVVTGSTASVNAPAANSMTTVSGSDFALPADGNYVCGVSTSGTIATNSVATFSWNVQVRNT